MASSHDTFVVDKVVPSVATGALFDVDVVAVFALDSVTVGAHANFFETDISDWVELEAFSTIDVASAFEIVHGCTVDAFSRCTSWTSAFNQSTGTVVLQSVTWLTRSTLVSQNSWAIEAFCTQSIFAFTDSFHAFSVEQLETIFARFTTFGAKK